MDDDWKARIRAVYGNLRRAVPPQLENYGALRTWQSATDWARTVADLRPGFARAAVVAAGARFTDLDETPAVVGPCASSPPTASPT